MAYNKTLWQNNSVPAINEGNLNKIEQGIYEAHNNIGDLSNLDTTNKDNLVEAINEAKLENYSTTETVVGKWIDGKPIYRKVLSTVGLSGATIKSINYNIINTDKIWIAGGFAYSIQRVVTLPMVGYNGDISQKIDVWVEKNENVVKLYSNGGWGNDWTFYVILEYTKTTD